MDTSGYVPWTCKSCGKTGYLVKPDTPIECTCRNITWSDKAVKSET